MKEINRTDLLREIIENCQVSGNVTRDFKDFYTIPVTLRGLKTLDIGAGASDWTAWLESRGAEAMAVDPLYGDFEELRQKYLDTKYAEMIHASKQAGRIPLSKDHPRFLDFVFDIYWEKFRDSFFNGTSLYIPASFDALPFKDSSFDRVFSFYGIFGAGDHEYGLLKDAVHEAIRVVKTGGILQLAPVLTGEMNEDQFRNQWKVTEEIMGDRNLTCNLSSRMIGDNPLTQQRLKLLTIRKKG